MLPAIGKQKLYPPLGLTVIHAQEGQAPAGRVPLQWKLITNLPVRSKSQAFEKIDWYAMRWKIETFQKILKSGCRAEDLRLRTADRLSNLIAIYCILSWRIFWVSMLHRTDPGTAPTDAFTDVEIAVLDRPATEAGGCYGRRRIARHAAHLPVHP
ncbi:MAG: transposase [Aquabacterium sp.]|uniref:transposase n=1 Tax=Aquabacterium sp. TaxID=1872578 RepID=UPI00271B49D5|nr:transposase [Aquabacterium sp.]MDO9002961.1 transposase [Aquabacterium sp.]